MTHRGRVMAHRILMSQSDRVLHDIGVSREELLGGVSNWPWEARNSDDEVSNTVAVAHVTDQHSPVEAVASQKTSRTFMGEKQAIRELSGYSDRELSDLGISRGMIAHAVKNGREDIDQVAPEPFQGGDKAAA